MLISKKLDPQIHKINFVKKFLLFLFLKQAVIFFLRMKEQKKEREKIKRLKREEKTTTRSFAHPCSALLYYCMSE